VTSILTQGVAVGSNVGISSLSKKQLRAIYTEKIKNWKELGGHDAKISIIGREPTEALFTVLKQTFPSFAHTSFAKVLKKDHQVVNYLKSPQGKSSIGFGAAPNFTALKTLDIADFSAGVSVGLVYDQKVKLHPVVVAAKKYAQSPDWKNRVTQTGLLPAN
jgi:PBP superfamily domain